MIDEDLKKFLPTFLPNGEQDELFYGLEQLRNNRLSTIKNFYTHNDTIDTILEQGDGIDGLPIFNLPELHSKYGKGFVISNTCDVSIDNTRVVPMRLLYAPVLNLEKYENALRESGDYSEDWGRAVREQQITHLFYLPVGSGLSYEAIVPLDQVNSIAPSYLLEQDLSVNKVFRLSLIAWYVLLIKLTHHFARTTNELIARKSSTAST